MVVHGEAVNHYFLGMLESISSSFHALLFWPQAEVGSVFIRKAGGQQLINVYTMHRFLLVRMHKIL